MITWEKAFSENTDPNVKYFSEEEFHNIHQKALKYLYCLWAPAWLGWLGGCLQLRS